MSTQQSGTSPRANQNLEQFPFIRDESNSGAVRLKLDRTVGVKRFPMIAKVSFKRERPDLVSLLKHTQSHADAMSPRLKAYLIREKLWDAKISELTDKGRGVLHSGFYEATERGLYHIWYSDDDPLLGTRPVFMQRDTAFFNPESKAWLSGVDAGRSSFAVDKELPVDALEEVYDGQKSRQVRQTLTLLRLEPEVICSSDQNAELVLNWELGPAGSRIGLKGELDVLDFNKNKPTTRPEAFEMGMHQFDHHFPLLMRHIADQYDGLWDDTDQRMVVQLKKMQQHASAVQSFTVATGQYANLTTEFGSFASIKAENIPIKPADQRDAQLWHRKWLETFYEDAYHSSEKARQQQAYWLDHAALADFELPLQDANNLLGHLSREGTPKAYWQVAAVADLSPAKSKKQRLPITLLNGDTLNLQQLVTQLSGGEVVRQMIYSDRYVHTSRQSRNLAAVAACIGDADGLLLTLWPQKGQEAELPDNWERQSFSKQHDNHGRFWVLIGASHTYCWECSSGLDFIRENEGHRVIEGTPGFTPKEEHELPGYLQDLVRKMNVLEVPQ